MAVKKAAARKAAPAKKASVKKASAKKIGAGESYACEVCGLAVTVDDVCGCVDAHDIVCCGAPMKKKRARK